MQLRFLFDLSVHLFAYFNILLLFIATILSVYDSLSQFQQAFSIYMHNPAILHREYRNPYLLSPDPLYLQDQSYLLPVESYL